MFYSSFFGQSSTVFSLINWIRSRQVMVRFNWGGYRPRRYSGRSSRSYGRYAVRSRPRYRSSRMRYTRAVPTVSVPRPVTRSRARVPSGLMKPIKVLKKIPFLLGQVDPFEDSVKGAKVPDSNTMQTETITAQDELSMALTTLGNVKAFLFNTAPLGAYVAATEGTGSWSWDAAYGGSTNLATAASMGLNYTGIRCVSHGIRLSSTVAPTSATGFVHIAIYAPSTYGKTTWPFPVSIAGMRDLPWYRKVTLASLTQSPLTVVNKFLDATAFRYTDPNETAGGFANANRGEFVITHSWATIVVAIEGTPISTVLTAENILHYEAIPLFGTQASVSPAAASSPVQMAAAGRISASANASHFEGSEHRTVAAQAAEAIAEAGASGIQGFSPYLNRAAEGAGALAGSFMLNALANAANNGLPGVNNRGRLT